ncbi:uncharacterized protein BKCO1_9800012 [Diplodia corticola]|uniref:Uncharacterized protein n=1 Tax=Diplodia corticola TaxID=236234 RepID=A0A1J9R9B3_9PEZI|nr:uncharacterized protein BKCO1_9800012 [Diplodia corticola]OJD29011.1 hypothetical protein BKCO1_9800012 [Diplodia corticola]
MTSNTPSSTTRNHKPGDRRVCDDIDQEPFAGSASRAAAATPPQSYLLADSLQANNFDSSKRTLGSERAKATWRKIKANTEMWWSIISSSCRSDNRGTITCADPRSGRGGQHLAQSTCHDVLPQDASAGVPMVVLDEELPEGAADALRAEAWAVYLHVSVGAVVLFVETQLGGRLDDDTDDAIQLRLSVRSLVLSSWQSWKEVASMRYGQVWN